ncbi:MAG: flagellar hook-basal body complex protein [Rhodocyclaceae bacterium]|nr:flagellar hook-basal body complex protein [Rhodocyclaceae bacterium]
MSFQQGLSGLDGSSKALDAIGNNIANANTVGFKESAAQFADVYAASLGGGGGSQIGIGANLATVSQQFTQGNITTTNNPLDVAINGSGMFRLSDNGTISYTRSGQFQLDKNGYVVNAAGLQVTGYAADPVTGTIVPGNMVPLQVNNTNIAPQVTTNSQIQVNEDSRSTPPAAMTSGSLDASAALAATTTISAANNTLNLTVDGLPVSITIPDGSYAPGTLVTTVQGLINSQLSASGAGVTVSIDTNNGMLITSNSKGTVGSQGAGSSVALTGTGGTAVTGPGAIAGLATAVAVTGADNFNPTTSGYATGSSALTTPTIVAGTNDTLAISVDNGVVVNALIPDPSGVPAGTTYTSLGLATAVQTAVNTALAAAGQNARVTASINASGQLVITSNKLGPMSTVAVTAGGGQDASATILGASPTSTPGTVNTASINSLGFTASTAQTVYDSLGNGHNLALYFVKTSQGNTWQLYTTLDGAQQQGPTKLQFNGAGALTTTMPITLPAANSSYAFANGANPLHFTLDLTGSTQYGIASGVNQLTQDGYTSGRLSGLSVSQDGTLLGSYSNGKSKNMGQLVLVSFNNPNGLTSLGGNQWAETSESGQPIPGTPGQGSLGALQSASVEESNVDLTKELVAMITQQRNYQANAQTIKTQDTIMQTLVNLG